jgi:peptidoglycan/xylan/chitin deacetylase (PgdA/CDA1 family)
MRFSTTRPLQLFFPWIRWKGPPNSLYLTFDDGPHPEATPRVLDVLSTHNIKATFFLLGDHVARYPHLARMIASEGHTVANHSYDHRVMIFRNGEFLQDQIVRTREAILTATGISTRHFRPPFGYAGPAVFRMARRLHHEVVLWDIDSGDFLRRNPADIAERSARQVQPGSILLFHDNDRTRDVISPILKAFLVKLDRSRFPFAALPS